MKRIATLIIYTLITLSVYAQKTPIDRVEPAFWWIGMKNPGLQLLIHGENISQQTVSLTYPGVTLQEITKAESPNYLFLTLSIGTEAKAGKVPLVFKNGKKTFTYSYELKIRSTASNRIQGFTASDVLYLIMPDRFANGNPTNDNVKGMLEGLERDKPFGRHGGDLKGISDHLDYIKDLGITAIWLNPVQENDQYKQSYHGYAITDFYKIDRRFGTNDEYVAFVEKSHSMGMKVIMDLVHNHSGIGHWWMKDLPFKDWIHQYTAKWPDYRSNFRLNVTSDPYASEADRSKMNDGWFDDHMPDLNQKNKFMAAYLIQNSLWWIEYAGIDGIRMDTYPYPDKDFMASWCKTILEEYPKFNIVGEVWMESIPTTAYWVANSPTKDAYHSTLPSATDFPFFFTVAKALTEPGSWDTGLTRLYNLLSQDFVYANPSGNVIFLDNHDTNRFFYDVQKDLNKYKMGMAFMLTTRGIPQLYYGTELLMDRSGASHADVRLDFPGGWPDDKVNAFTKEGRTVEQDEAINYIKTLASWRKTKSVIHTGKLMQFIPEDNIYIYFRYNDAETVMVVMNGNTSAKKLSTERFAERTNGFKMAKNALTSQKITDLSVIDIPAQTTLILELEK
ncbi:glycoside hydrolase family 13 protein [Rhodocytophaga rosea]|uniref:Glycoside hydrolase family 13 protein n=1 Tax=Rhodocytophaga rosea TaxID=2704465 RepID=A0A6C0GJ87_9BACT|nr:glycoside hydrolase family 13 protein [Rhodocytophaga rosea]QHT67732.1 glycoside hydrolase family 13 protein [Rhodocytophaga rosea]